MISLKHGIVSIGYGKPNILLVFDCHDLRFFLECIHERMYDIVYLVVERQKKKLRKSEDNRDYIVIKINSLYFIKKIESYNRKLH